MKSKQLIMELLEYVDLFEQVAPGAEDMTIEGFLAFANSLHLDRASQRRYSDKATQMTAVEIARNLSLLHRYSRSYIKAALSASAYLQTEEEYTYLVTLLAHPRLTKTELHTLNGMEKTSGAEIIRRLKKYGLLCEEPDERDKRSVCVSITPEGRAELMKVFPRLRTAADIVSAPLQPDQQNSLLFLLRHLCVRHAAVARQRSSSSLEEILSDLGGAPEPTPAEHPAAMPPGHPTPPRG